MNIQLPSNATYLNSDECLSNWATSTEVLRNFRGIDFSENSSTKKILRNFSRTGTTCIFAIAGDQGRSRAESPIETLPGLPHKMWAPCFSRDLEI